MSPIPGLSGAKRGVLFTRKEDSIRAVDHLMQCEAHGGVHHFAVTREGLAVWMSPTGFECLTERYPFMLERRVRVTPPPPESAAD